MICEDCHRIFLVDDSLIREYGCPYCEIDRLRAELTEVKRERDEWKARFGKTPKEIDGRISMWEEMQPDIDALRAELAEAKRERDGKDIALKQTQALNDRLIERLQKQLDIERKALELACKMLAHRAELLSANPSMWSYTPDELRKLAKEKK